MTGVDSSTSEDYISVGKVLKKNVADKKFKVKLLRLEGSDMDAKDEACLKGKWAIPTRTADQVTEDVEAWSVIYYFDTFTKEKRFRARVIRAVEERQLNWRNSSSN